MIIKTKKIESLVEDPRSVDKASIINGAGNISKIGRIKSYTNFRVKLFKSKITVRPDFLVKSQLLAELSSKPGFLTSRARLTFVTLRQVYIKTLIL